MFLLAPLAALPKTFGLEVEDKGYFPHLFTTHNNLDRQLTRIPDAHFYQPEWMKPGDRHRFEQWHAQQRQADQQSDATAVRFHLRQQLVDYCSNDVRILMEASMKYRQTMMDKTDLDPFAVASTCAGLAMATFRGIHLRRNTITHTPEGGPRRGWKASTIAHKYIRLYEMQNALPAGSIRTEEWALGEAPHPDDSGKRLDGFLERHGQRPLAIEFLGWYAFSCIFNTSSIQILKRIIYNLNVSFWHGCPRCYPGAGRQLHNAGRTMESLYTTTQQRLYDLEHQHGYDVHAKWECDFRRELQQDPELKRQYDSLFIPDHLDPRVHSLRGGRTEPFAFSHRCELDDEEIFLLDIVCAFVCNLCVFSIVTLTHHHYLR